jgi:hypothetical protein
VSESSFDETLIGEMPPKLDSMSYGSMAVRPDKILQRAVTRMQPYLVNGMIRPGMINTRVIRRGRGLTRSRTCSMP